MLPESYIYISVRFVFAPIILTSVLHVKYRCMYGADYIAE